MFFMVYEEVVLIALTYQWRNGQKVEAVNL